MSRKAVVLTISMAILVLTQGYAQTTIQFAGRTWYVKTGYGGPGPNYWSDSPQSVWVDGNGALHLKIRFSGGRWYCSEVWSQNTTRYGMHRFYADCRLDSLDRNIVVGLFLYANDTTEVDMEFAKWGSLNTYNSWYVVQPPHRPTNVDSFQMRLNGTYTTHYFNWQRDSIRFKSIHGHRQDDSLGYYLIHSWLYTGADNPRELEALKVHINLWLYQGLPPSNQQEVELVVTGADLPSGVEESGEEIPRFKPLFRITPNPFTSFARVPGNQAERFFLYDISGRQVGTYRGDRVGADLAPGVYFLMPLNGDSRPIRIVKVR